MNPLPLIIGGVAAAIAAVVSKKGAPAGASYELDQGMPPQFEQQVLLALTRSTSPPELLMLAAQMQQQGYPLAAAALTKRANELGGAPAPTGPTPTPAANVPPPPAPPPAPAPAPVSVDVGPATDVQVVIDPSEIAPGLSVHPLMSNDEWVQTLVLLNDWLAQYHDSPLVNWIDLTWWRNNVDDLQDQGNFQLAVEAMYAWANQTNVQIPQGGLPGQTNGTLDAYTAATLYAWANTYPGQLQSNTAIIEPFALAIMAAVNKKLAPATQATAGARYLPARLARSRR